VVPVADMWQRPAHVSLADAPTRSKKPPPHVCVGRAEVEQTREIRRRLAGLARPRVRAGAGSVRRGRDLTEKRDG